jgi:lipoate-protein ligase A
MFSTLNAWRLLELETHDAYMNMAIDEVILNARIEGRTTDTLRLYRWKRSAVSIGRFQKVENEVQWENCAEQGVDVVRRITGGGTVYHDAEGEITYSVVAAKESLKANDIGEVYARIYSGLTAALGILGLVADFNEGNVKACPNLTVNRRKISGSAQCHKYGVVLQHGTILARVNLEKMFRCLRVPWAENCMQVVRVAKDKLTSLRDELGKDVPNEEISRALVEGFQRALGMKLNGGMLTAYERELAERLYRDKYVKDDWNLRGESSDFASEPIFVK